MMYCDYPEVKQSDRLARALPLDEARIRVSPAEAWSKLQTPGDPDDVTLAMFDGRPAYWFRLGRSRTAVYADNGQAQSRFTPELNLRTAAAWTSQPAAAARVQPVRSVDQWTVGGIYNRFAPLTRYSWPDGAEVYVSARTGQVVQFTTRASRLKAWLGPIPHWLYFTPLRKNPVLWSRIVIWLSGAATIVAILGLIAGLSMYSPKKRYRSDGRPTSVPYAGAKRLHMILGLFFGLLACTWAFSGMLSMDPFPSKPASDPDAVSQIAAALGGEPFSFAAFERKGPREALAEVGSGMMVKEMEFVLVGGQPFYVATEGGGESRLIPVNGLPLVQFSAARLTGIIESTAQIAEAGLIRQYDAYYLDRHHELPLPAFRIRLADAAQTRVYIDPRTARIVGSYNSADWKERWLYHGFHSINLPWLYKHRPAWDVAVLAMMLGGTSLCVSSVIIGWRLLRRNAILRV